MAIFDDQEAIELLKQEVPAEAEEAEFLQQLQVKKNDDNWLVVAPKNVNAQEVDNVIADLEPILEKAMRMGPVRRKLHGLRTSFGRWVYDQKTKRRYNAALKRGEKPTTLTAEAAEQLWSAMEHALSEQGLSHADDGRVANTNENSGREM